MKSKCKYLYIFVIFSLFLYNKKNKNKNECDVIKDYIHSHVYESNSDKSETNKMMYNKKQKYVNLNHFNYNCTNQIRNSCSLYNIFFNRKENIIFMQIDVFEHFTNIIHKKKRIEILEKVNLLIVPILFQTGKFLFMSQILNSTIYYTKKLTSFYSYSCQCLFSFCSVLCYYILLFFHVQYISILYTHYSISFNRTLSFTKSLFQYSHDKIQSLLYLQPCIHRRCLVSKNRKQQVLQNERNQLFIILSLTCHSMIFRDTYFSDEVYLILIKCSVTNSFVNLWLVLLFLTCVLMKNEYCIFLKYVYTFKKIITMRMQECNCLGSINIQVNKILKTKDL